jgi:hypothetical protein
VQPFFSRNSRLRVGLGLASQNGTPIAILWHLTARSAEPLDRATDDEHGDEGMFSGGARSSSGFTGRQ